MFNFEVGQAVLGVIILPKKTPANTHKTASPVTSRTDAANHMEKPISNVYPVIDNDLARDNVENDIPAADLEDL